MGVGRRERDRASADSLGGKLSDVPWQEEPAVWKRGMNHAAERAGSGGKTPAGGREKFPVDERRQHASPEQARDDEARGEKSDREEFTGQRAGRHGPCGEQLVGLDRHKRGERRHAGDRHRRIVSLRRGMETLGRDLQADEDEDRQDRRAGNDLVEVGKRAGEAGGADDGRRGERVGRPAPPRLVGGVANVGRGLDHATAGTGDDRCDPLDADDGAGVVFITGRRGRAGMSEEQPEKSNRVGHIASLEACPVVAKIPRTPLPVAILRAGRTTSVGSPSDLSASGFSPRTFPVVPA